MRLPGAPPPGAPYAGGRVIVGGVVQWTEAGGRKNRDHYLEIDLAQTPGYGTSLSSFADLRLCFDAPYDSCFYDPAGKYPEGRSVSYDGFLGHTPVPVGGGWTHIVLDYGSVLKALH